MYQIEPNETTTMLFIFLPPFTSNTKQKQTNQKYQNYTKQQRESAK